MGKRVADSVLDAALDKIGTANIMVLCSAEPTTRTEAITTYALADVAMSGVDFTNSNGDTSGRKCAVAAKSGVTVDTSGTGNHVALCDGSELLYVTTCDAQVVTSGNTVDFPTWDAEIADPS